MVARSQLQLGRTDAGVRLTHEQFAEAVFEEPWRYERVNGRLVVMVPSGHDHIDAGEPIRDHFVAYRQTDEGRRATAGAAALHPRIAFYEVITSADPTA